MLLRCPCRKSRTPYCIGNSGAPSTSTAGDQPGPVENCASRSRTEKVLAAVALDMLGDATIANATLLRSLRRGGRMVLMGSMSSTLPINYVELMVNNWELIGNFMYGRDAFLGMAALVRGGLLDLARFPVTTFPLERLPEAMDDAARRRGLETVVVTSGVGRRRSMRSGHGRWG